MHVLKAFGAYISANIIDILADGGPPAALWGGCSGPPEAFALFVFLLRATRDYGLFYSVVARTFDRIYARPRNTTENHINEFREPEG